VQITTNPTRRKYEHAKGLNLVSFSQSQLFVRVSHVITWFAVWELQPMNNWLSNQLQVCRLLWKS